MPLDVMVKLVDVPPTPTISLSPAQRAGPRRILIADKVKTPTLLIHGEADNNTGTFPIQSERFYDALKGE